MSNSTQQFTITDADAPARLDRYLADQLSLSRSLVRKLVEAGAITINQRSVVKPGLTLEVGDLVVVDDRLLNRSQTVLPNPEIKIPVLYADDDLLIVNKPAGMGVHPLDPMQTTTVLNGLVADYPQIQNVGEGKLRSGVIHRLDLDTTGTLMVALTNTGYERGRNAITAKNHTLKRYRAIVHGKIRKDSAKLAKHLIIAQHQPAKVKVLTEPQPQSRLCTMSFTLMRQMDNTADISIDLQTGFLHQIRAMMADIGHPVVGDTLYGSPESNTRTLLHAQRIKFDDIDVIAPIPDEMKHAAD
jgi:23S rRNA pseudouridine1911/1915/1917 synthase